MTRIPQIILGCLLNERTMRRRRETGKSASQWLWSGLLLIKSSPDNLYPRCALLPSLEPGFSLLSTANLLDSVGSSLVVSLSSLKSREIKKISHAPLNPNDNDNGNVFPDVSICPPPPPMYSHGTMLFRRNTFYNNRSNFRGIPLLKGFQTFVSFRWWNLPREIFKNYVIGTSYGFIIHIQRILGDNNNTDTVSTTKILFPLKFMFSNTLKSDYW